MRRKKYVYLILIAVCISIFIGCSLPSVKINKNPSTNNKEGDITLMLVAAASLEASLEKSIIPLFEEKNPHIKVQGSYDGSGKLALQIQEGIPADIFLSAATGPMEDLKSKGFIIDESIVNLLENKLVLIVPKASRESYKSFEDIVSAKNVAIGDPESVPAGEYGKEILEDMGIWEEVYERASLGTNVTEVLRWVAEGSAAAGLVYVTDAALEKDKVAVVEEAPEEFLKSKILYPAGIIKSSEKLEAAEEFLTFLTSKEVNEIFKSYGFFPIAK